MLVILAALSLACAETDSESDPLTLECMANYLKDKNLLDDKFTSYTRKKPFVCDLYMSNVCESTLDKAIESMLETSSDDSSEVKRMKKVLAENSACIRQQLLAISYQDDTIKYLLYSETDRLTEDHKAKIVDEAENELLLKGKFAEAMCASSFIFGEIFDDAIKNSRGNSRPDDDRKTSNDAEAIENLKAEYCIRKYVVDNGIVDTKEFTINLNPTNLELNFECEDPLKGQFSMMEEIVFLNILPDKDDLEGAGSQLKSEVACLRSSLKNAEALTVFAKVAVLSEISLSDLQILNLRSDFMTKIRKMYKNMRKCF